MNMDRVGPPVDARVLRATRITAQASRRVVWLRLGYQTAGSDAFDRLDQ